MEQEIVLRHATVDDSALLAELAARLFAQTFGAANTTDDMAAFLAATYTAEQQTAELADPDRRTWLAVAADGTAIGFAMLRRNRWSDGVRAERPVEVQRIYADQAVHGRGVGARLMDACLATASEWKADVIWLAVWERNARAIAFYEKSGFQRVGVQDFQLGSDTQHDHVMARNLSISS
jgi:GNAT superfamily N-acetyltransferase